MYYISILAYIFYTLTINLFVKSVFITAASRDPNYSLLTFLTTILVFVFSINKSCLNMYFESNNL